MKIRILPTAAVILLLACVSNAQKATQPAKIDAYVRTITSLTTSPENNKIVVADTAVSGQKESKWQKFESEKALEERREQNETYSIAYNWKKQGKLVASSFTQFSESGDWVQYISYYFRLDGTVAKVEDELRTFYGNYIVNRDFYFDEKGNVIAKKVKYSDLETNKPKKPSKELFEANSERLKSDFFKRADKLPFASLIASK
jgi:hypothetical protein